MSEGGSSVAGSGIGMGEEGDVHHDEGGEIGIRFLIDVERVLR